MKQRNIILGLIIILAVALFAVFLVQRTSRSYSDTGGNTTTTTSKTWKTYSDGAGEYSVSYPGEYSVFPTNTKDPSFAQPKDRTIISQVGFGLDPNAGPSGFSITVSSTTYTDSIKWIENQDKIYGSAIGLTSVIEKHITIDGNDAIVTYQKDNAESFPDEKRVILIKDGMVYEIMTRIGNDNNEKVWGGFRFTQ